MATWTFDPTTRTYRSSTGRALTRTQLTAIRNTLANFTAEQARLLARQYAKGALGLDQWAVAFRALLEESTTAGYLLGRGGVNASGMDSLLRIDQLIRAQTDFAAQFARDVGSGGLTPEQMEARSALYAGSTVQAYEEARAAGAGISLPSYPGDGSQDCMGNCRCEWVIEETEQGYEATWELDPSAQHCATCLENADRYAPYVQETVSGTVVV